MVTVGDRIPNDLAFAECEWTPALEDPKVCPAPPQKTTAADAFKNKTTVIVSVPGSFTPTCHGNHVPSLLARSKEFADKGVQIYVISQNDPYVMSGWRSSLGGRDEIHFATELDLGLSKFLNATVDMSKVGFGTRGGRYAVIIEPDLTIKSFDLESSANALEVSTPESILRKL